MSNVLQIKYTQDSVEVGIDEAGRGPMFGRVYAAAVVLPLVDFDHLKMKDSKKFHSKQKIQEVSEYIKTHALAWAVEYSSEGEIDEYNIRAATHMAMHKTIKSVLLQVNQPIDNIHLLVDGNDFTPYMYFEDDIIMPVKYTCITKGDNKVTNIAAASILAKVARDSYIADLCKNEPDLDIKYGLARNMGYGTKLHMEGIAAHGISKYHRKTFGVCQKYST